MGKNGKAVICVSTREATLRSVCGVISNLWAFTKPTMAVLLLQETGRLVECCGLCE
jgi:hypothetical protein